MTRWWKEMNQMLDWVTEAVKLTFNVEVPAGYTSNLHLPQIILHTKLYREKTCIIIII